jgi:hypothetical protein
MRKCKNCDAPIGNLERAFAWEGAIVCGPCHAKLSAPHVVNPDQVFDSLEDLVKGDQKKSSPKHAGAVSVNISRKKLFAIVAIPLIALMAFAIWRSNEREMDAGFAGTGSSEDIVKNLPNLSPADAKILGLSNTAKNNAPDPEFSISGRSYSGENMTTGAGWEVTNESQSPLTISRFNINAEFDAPIGYARDIPKSSGWPRQPQAASFVPSLKITPAITSGSNALPFSFRQ